MDQRRSTYHHAITVLLCLLPSLDIQIIEVKGWRDLSKMNEHFGALRQRCTLINTSPHRTGRFQQSPPNTCPKLKRPPPPRHQPSLASECHSQHLVRARGRDFVKAQDAFLHCLRGSCLRNTGPALCYIEDTIVPSIVEEYHRQPTLTKSCLATNRIFRQISAIDATKPFQKPSIMLPTGTLLFTLSTLLTLLTTIAPTATALPVFHTNLPGSYPDRVEDLVSRAYRPHISKRQQGGDSRDLGSIDGAVVALSGAPQTSGGQDAGTKKRKEKRVGASVVVVKRSAEENQSPSALTDSLDFPF